MWPTILAQVLIHVVERVIETVFRVESPYKTLLKVVTHEIKTNESFDVAKAVKRATPKPLRKLLDKVLGDDKLKVS